LEDLALTLYLEIVLPRGCDKLLISLAKLAKETTPPGGWSAGQPLRIYCGCGWSASGDVARILLFQFTPYIFFLIQHITAAIAYHQHS
jgi:hypothetical protein